MNDVRFAAYITHGKNEYICRDSTLIPAPSIHQIENMIAGVIDDSTDRIVSIILNSTNDQTDAFIDYELLDNRAKFSMRLNMTKEVISDRNVDVAMDQINYIERHFIYRMSTVATERKWILWGLQESDIEQ